MKSWSIPGAAGEVILGESHIPKAQPRGHIVIAHGFKGYKDYGMFPRIASRFAEAGFVAHRFNFSHSGMTNNIDTFERPDLFERDTWNKQVHDLKCVIETQVDASLRDAGSANLPYILFGHSRGGVTTLLTAGRFADDPTFPQPAAVITAAAPDTCNSLSKSDAATLLEQGYLESPSSRTGQTLRIGRAFLQEQLDDPASHDVLSLAAKITCPLLLIHGEEDPTVAPQAAANIAQAAGDTATMLLIPHANHVFNTPNPLPAGAAANAQLEQLIGAAIRFAVQATPPA